MCTPQSCHNFRVYLEVCEPTVGGPLGTKLLQYYLLVLRGPLVSEIFRSSYTKASRLSEKASSPTTKKKTVVGSDRSQSLAFPIIQPMKSALYFDDIEGFGEWSILLSTRAQKDLRDYKRADGAMFRIIMKKMKCDPTLLVITAADSIQTTVPGSLFK
jgi:hypothetical protein